PDKAGRAEILAKMIRQLIERHEEPGFRMFADDVDPRGLAQVSAGMTGADLKESLRRVQLPQAVEEGHSGAVQPPFSQDHATSGNRRGANVSGQSAGVYPAARST